MENIVITKRNDGLEQLAPLLSCKEKDWDTIKAIAFWQGYTIALTEVLTNIEIKKEGR